MRMRHILGELRRIVSAAMRALAVRSPHQDAILDEAISNLPHGVLVFDKDRRVVTCNPRYRDIYHLAPDRVKPGTPVSDLIRHRLTLGLVTPVDPEEYIRDRMSKPVAASDGINEYTDGRTIAHFTRPMSGGGGIAVYEDITERKALQQRLEEQDALA